MSYIGAPYNFVDFPKKTYSPVKKADLEVHDRITDRLLAGEVSYSITAKTPVFIDNGQGEFFKDEYGRYAIPGSTIRGLLRNNVQILSASSFDNDIEDYKLMYRHVAAGALQKEYNKNIKNVKAGVIKCENGKYYIYQTKIESVADNMPNYYILSERTVVDSYSKDRSTFPYDLFIDENGKSIMQHEIDKEFKKKGRHYIGTKNKDYHPYYKECSYIANGKDITAVSIKDKYPNKGYIISSGVMNEHKAIYIIPEIDFSNGIHVSESDIRAYNIDFEKKKTTLKPNEKFFALPESGETKPVFYTQLNESMYLGFTPRLRVFFKHSIKDGYRQEYAGDGQFDMATSLFGLSDKERGNFKSKVSVSDATIDEGVQNADTQEAVNVVLAEPKPTSYLDYVVQDDSEHIKTYSSDDFQLRGVKQYWLHENVDIGEQNDNNDKVGSAIKPLQDGTVFKGVIRFNNLSDNELGLLLWALKLEQDSHMNIGKGKPYGYGRIAISDVQVKVLDCTEAYSLDKLSFNPFKWVDPKDYINIYKSTQIDGVKIGEIPSVKNFLDMKKMTPDSNKIKYMSIDDYQERQNNALGNIEQVLKEKICVDKTVLVTKVQKNNKDPNQLVASFDGGMAFGVPLEIHQGDRISIKVTSAKDNGKIYGEFINKI